MTRGALIFIPWLISFYVVLAPGPTLPPPLPAESQTLEEQLLAHEPQRTGDPKAGYSALVNGGYMTCGLPWNLYRSAIGPGSSGLQGRTGLNRKLPLELSATKNKNGVWVVSPNCLGCHASHLNGEFVMGLGDVHIDMTQDLTLMAWSAQFFTASDGDHQAWQDWYARLSATAKYTKLDTIGVHSADNLASALAAHRDPKTLAWKSAQQFSPPEYVVPTDVPAWWLMKKKAALYQTGIGRGDQARLMMSSSLYCTDEVKEAERIDRAFVDVRAYVLTLDAPKYPGRVNSRRAREGRDVFEGHCADCHGTYEGPKAHYPNKVIPLAEVGTDPLLSRGSQAEVNGLIPWFNESFYGKRSRLQPTRGYVAPPLDGVWATAPYFHNGSVPTLEGVLDGTKRPRFWKKSASRSDYDVARPGRKFEALTRGKDGASDADARKWIYDTTQPGYSNEGHTFGDDLSEEQRRAVIEYLKTL